MKNFQLKLVTAGMAASLVAMTATANATTVIDSVNQNASPREGSSWIANNVGWFYTPTSSYQLTGLATRFRTADGRAVTASFYSGAPGSLFLLGRGTLTAGTGFTEALFTTPVSLTSGTQYFFAFSNVANLGVNVTSDAGATSLAGGLRFDFGPAPGTFGAAGGGFVAQPIVQFLGTASAVPEPSTWLMLILGLAAIGATMRQARRRQNIAVSYT
jgi:hypothetical protein